MKKRAYLLIAILLIFSACQPIQQQMNRHQGGMQGHQFNGQNEGKGSSSMGQGRMHHFNQPLQSSTGEN